MVQLKVCSNSQVILRSRNSIQKFSNGRGKKKLPMYAEIFSASPRFALVWCVISLDVGEQWSVGKSK